MPTPTSLDTKYSGTQEVYDHKSHLPLVIRQLGQPPSSPTSATSMEPSGGEQLSLLGDSHANRFPKPGSDEARTMTATSGRKCSELLVRPGPVGSLVKMLLESSTWHSTRCLLTWKAKATKSGRLLFQLRPSTPRTEGIGSGLLLKTPDASVRENQESRGEWGTSGTLAQEFKSGFVFLRTPDAHMERGPRSPENMHERYVVKGQPLCLNDQLRMVELGMLPTPRGMDATHDWKKASKDRNRSSITHETLGHVVGSMLPTPRVAKDIASDLDKARVRVEKTGYHANLEEAVAMEMVEPGKSPGLKLQPAFVEWMMGYPFGFTLTESRGSKPSATPSSPRSPTKSSKVSRK